MTIRVVTAAADAATESAVVSVLASDPGAQLVRRCRDLVELRAVVATTDLDVAVVDGRLRGLDRDVVNQLVRRGVRCVIVDGVGDGAHDWVAAGAVATIGPDLHGLDVSIRAPVGPTTVEPPRPPTAESAHGRVVAVWGPPGAPGRSTVALEVACALTRQGADVWLVDADTVAPSLAHQLGLIDDTSGLAAAVRAAGRGHVDPVELAGLAVSVPAGPRVLTGLPSADRWAELRPAAVEAVLDAARTGLPWTVVDIGFGIEGGDLGWADPAVPQRFGAACATLATADVVLCVGRADPLGVVRLLRHLPEVRGLAPTAEIWVVMNRGVDREASALLAEHVAAPWVLPDDPASVTAAVRHGRAVAEVAPRSRLTLAVDALTAELVGAARGRELVAGRGAGRSRGSLLGGTVGRRRKESHGQRA